MNPSRVEVFKRIADPVHGTIGLTKLETEVIDTRVFQRLRNVKHLGLAYLVYPAADFSRFAHSLGVCHVTGLLLDALLAANENLTRDDIQKYRLAGLLHDIGHYPLSHALEKPVKDYVKAKIQAPLLEGGPVAAAPTARTTDTEELNHEVVGKRILECDNQLQEILTGNGVDPTEISDIITRAQKEMAGPEDIAVNPLVNLVSSDLDADRIDFLLRSSKSTGLPYGSVDLEYIISQIQIDDDGRVCLHERAMHTADHLLLARFFDTQTVAMHKTVAGFETLAQIIVAQLLQLGILTIDDDWIRAQISGDSWATFDDAWLMSLMASVASGKCGNVDDLLREKINALLERRAPKLMASKEYFRRTNEEELADDHFNRIVREFSRASAEAEDKFDLKGYFLEWNYRDFRLNKSSGLIPTDALEQAGAANDDKLVQAVRILPRVRKARLSRPIMSMPNSLMSILSNNALDSVRLYLVEPPNRPGIAHDEVRPWLQERLGL